MGPIDLAVLSTTLHVVGYALLFLAALIEWLLGALVIRASCEWEQAFCASLPLASRGDGARSTRAPPTARLAPARG
jgi:hypothetical protein